MMQVGIVGIGKNGFMNQIMQSETDTNKIIKTCEELIAMGYNPSIVIEQACLKNNLNMNSLTETDKIRIIKKIENISKQKQNKEYK